MEFIHTVSFAVKQNVLRFNLLGTTTGDLAHQIFWMPHSSCLESLRGESELMTLGNLICAGCGTGNGGGVGCAGGKVGRNPTLPPAHPPSKEKKGGPP